MAEKIKGKIFKHKLTGEKVIALNQDGCGCRYGNPIRCRIKNYEEKWFFPEELKEIYEPKKG